MPLAKLSIDLEARLAGLQEGFDKAQRMAETAAQKMSRAFDVASAAAINIGGALTASLAGGALVAFVKNTVNGVDRLNDLSDATGASVEKLSALEDQALRSGNSFESASDALVKLNKALSEAKPGSSQEQAINAIGLSVEKLKIVDPAEALKQVASALAEFENNGAKARITQELFGKSLREVAPLLKDLAEQGALVGTVTKKQAEEAEKFNKELANLAKNSTDTARSFVGELLPALNEVFARIKSGREIFGSLAGLIKSSLSAESFSDAGAGVANYTKEIKKLQEIRAIVADKGGKDPFRGDLKSIDEQIAKAQKLEAFYRRVFALTANDNGQSDKTELARRGKLAGGLKTLADLPDKPAKVAADKITEAERYIESLQKQLDKTQELTAYETALGLITSGRLKADGAVSTERILSIAKEIDAYKEAERAAKAASDFRKADYEAAEAAFRANEQADRDRVRAIVDQTATAKLKVVLKDVELINRAFNNGADETELWAESIRVATGKLTDGGKDDLDELSQFAVQAAHNIQDTLGNSLEAALSGNFSNIGKLWTDLLRRLAAQAAAAQLNKYLFGADFGKTGNIGGVLGDVFKGLVGYFSGGSIDNSATGDIIRGRRAGGGPVDAGMPYLVGERGPEIVVPRNSANVLPNGVGLGRAITNIINVTVNGPMPQETAAQVRNIVREEQSRFARNLSLRGAV